MTAKTRTLKLTPTEWNELQATLSEEFRKIEVILKNQDIPAGEEHYQMFRFGVIDSIMRQMFAKR